MLSCNATTDITRFVQGVRNVVQVGFAGKCKTTLQMIAIALLLLVPTGKGSALVLLHVGFGVLYLAALLTVLSGLGYFQAAWPYLME